MGYNAGLNFYITFPTREALDAAIAEAKELFTSDWDDFSAITDGLSENSDWDNPEGDPLVFAGWGGGKLSWDNDAVLKVLADAGVTGYIDGRGEDDALWRWRFAEGQYKEYSGEIVYPEDPYAEEATA
jgi:hypothetical protein